MNDWEVVHTTEEGVVTVAPDYRRTERGLNFAQSDRLRLIATELAQEIETINLDLRMMTHVTNQLFLPKPNPKFRREV